MSGALYVDSGPVIRWLDEEILPRYGSVSRLAEVLAERTAIQPKSWQRNLIRYHNRKSIDFFTLDRLCTLLGEHVSRFCEAHEQLSVNPSGSFRFKLALVREPAPAPFGTQVLMSADSAALATALLADEFQEVSLAMFFDRQNKLTGYIEVGRGGIAHSPMEPREILVAALAANAASVIVAHNHPSGNLEPSSDDRAITTRLEKACKLVGLTLLDHILVGAGGDYRNLIGGP